MCVHVWVRVDARGIAGFTLFTLNWCLVHNKHTAQNLSNSFIYLFCMQTYLLDPTSMWLSTTMPQITLNIALPGQSALDAHRAAKTQNFAYIPARLSLWVCVTFVKAHCSGRNFPSKL